MDEFELLEVSLSLSCADGVGPICTDTLAVEVSDADAFAEVESGLSSSMVVLVLCTFALECGGKDRAAWRVKWTDCDWYGSITSSSPEDASSSNCK